MPHLTRPISFAQIVTGYAFAGCTLCLGYFFSLKVGAGQFGEFDAATIFLRLFYFLALAIVLNFTIALGRLRGFPLRSARGDFQFTHLLRILVMTAIVWGAVCLLFAPALLFMTRRV